MKKKLFFLFCLLIVNIFLWQAVFQFSHDNLEVTFLDVKQGDAIFIITPEKHNILIDGGPSPIVLEYLQEKIPFGQKNIDLVILTHAHDDHYAGLIDVFQRYDVEKFLWNGVESEASSFLKFQELFAKTNISVIKKGQRIKAGSLVLDILHPEDPEQFRNLNNTSVVTRAVFDNNSFLFTGDIHEKVEQDLLLEKIDVDVLQVSHHGSKTSSSKEFLKEVDPEYAVISVGLDNSYGHPDEQVLQRIKKNDIILLRTDQMGNINFFSDGNNINKKI